MKGGFRIRYFIERHPCFALNKLCRAGVTAKAVRREGEGASFSLGSDEADRGERVMLGSGVKFVRLYESGFFAHLKALKGKAALLVSLAAAIAGTALYSFSVDSVRVTGVNRVDENAVLEMVREELPSPFILPGEDFSAAEKLIDYFELDPKGKIRSMSKGMKQKTALVAAFMHDPEILLLDEPSSGLDPLMQGKLIELIENEKKRGKTILLSSHIFEEVEKTCDRIGMIKSGRIIRQITADELRVSQMKTYVVIMADDEGCAEILRMYPDAVRGKEQRELKVSVTDGCINELLALLSAHRVLSLTEEKHTLEEYFMKFYGGDEK